MKKIMMACLLVAGCVKQQGCISGDDGQQPAPQPEPVVAEAKTNGPVYYLCVGMESSKRFGACPGCALDATRLDSLFKGKFGYKGDLLISDKATKSAVVSKLTAGMDAVGEDGLFLFCYSGHGGQESLGGKEPDGADRQDEYLCLYDTYMLDDEIWDIVSKCRGRVFMYFDACHSATMYRSIKSDATSVNGVARALGANDLVWSGGFTFRPERFVKANAQSVSGGERALVPNILCWSGCKEAEYSYGGNDGGVMTSSLVSGWKKGISYDSLWTKVVRGVQREQPTQHPVQTRIGAGFDGGSEAFR